MRLAIMIDADKYHRTGLIEKDGDAFNWNDIGWTIEAQRKVDDLLGWPPFTKIIEGIDRHGTARMFMVA